MSKVNDRNHNKQTRPVVSARIKNLLTGSAQASVTGSVTQRAAAVREALGKKLSEAQAPADRQLLNEKLPYAPVELAQWLNWGNWGNWANWNNWNNWQKWSNWGDFSNW